MATPHGTRYLSGRGAALLRHLLVLLLICRVRWPCVLVVADAAGWIRTWFAAARVRLPSSALILDWWHLRKRCAELASMVCRGRKAKARLLRQVYRQLWRGDVSAALDVLEAYRVAAKDSGRLEQWNSYLLARAP